MKILSLSLDYDDCLIRVLDNTGKIRSTEFDKVVFDEVVNAHIPPVDHIKWRKNLIDDNPELITYIKRIAVNYDKIIICCGSNRQNLCVEVENSCRGGEGFHFYTGTCYEGLKIFRDKLQEVIGKPIILSSLLMADILKGVDAGTTVKKIESWLRGEQLSSADFDRVPLDRSKIALHYMYMHDIFNYFGKNNIEVEMDYLVIDDHYQGKLQRPFPGIIDAINDVYGNFQQLIPQNCTLITLPYQNGKLLEQAVCKFLGTGVVDAAFRKTVMTFMIECSEGHSCEERGKYLKEYASCQCWDLFQDDQRQRIGDLLCSLVADPFLSNQRKSPKNNIVSSDWSVALFPKETTQKVPMTLAIGSLLHRMSSFLGDTVTLQCQGSVESAHSDKQEDKNLLNKSTTRLLGNP